MELGDGARRRSQETKYRSKVQEYRTHDKLGLQAGCLAQSNVGYPRFGSKAG